MLELLFIFIFGWLFVKVIGFTLALTWGLAKLVCGLVIGLALPVLIACLVFAGGIALLVPILMLAVVAGIVKAIL